MFNYYFPQETNTQVRRNVEHLPSTIIIRTTPKDREAKVTVTCIMYIMYKKYL